MNQVILVILIAVMAYMIFMNVKLMRKNKNMKRYFVCTDAILNGDSNANEVISDFIYNETSDELKNKARVLKMIAELDQGIDALDTLSLLSYDDIILTNGQLDKKKFEFNSDSFFWTINVIIKAYDHEQKEVAEAIKEKLAAYEEYPLFKNDVVVRLIYETDKAMSGYGDKGITFFEKLLSGEYSEYTYDKRMIGFYKNVAAAMMAYLKQPLSEDDVELIKAFARMKAGKVMLGELGLYSTYLEDDENGTDEHLDDYQAQDEVIDAVVKIKDSEDKKEDQ